MARELASVITNPRWADRIASTQTSDELLKATWAVFLAAVAKSHKGPDIRDTTRLRATQALIALTAELEQ